MKLSIYQNGLVAMVTLASMVATAAPHSQSSKARKVKPQRVISMAYNVADRLESEAYDLSVSELKIVQKHLRQVRKTLNGQGTDGGGSYGEASYSSSCVAIEKTTYGNISRTVGSLKGTLSQITSDCVYLATSQYGDDAGMKLKGLEVTSIGSSTTKGKCTLLNKTTYGTISTSMGVIYGNSLSGLHNSCNDLAKAMIGPQGSSRISSVEIDI